MSASEISGNGYKKENPPEDDCCPICFGSFTLPCRTSCGHWFCSQCILEYRRYCKRTKWCKCPMCGTDVTKLIPHSSLLIRPSDEEQRIINDVISYTCNDIHDVSVFRLLWAIFLQAHTIPSWAELRRRYRADINAKLPESLKRVMSVVMFLLVVLYLFSGLPVPYGGFWLILGMEVPISLLDLFLRLDAAWHMWNDEPHQRHLEADAIAQNEG